MPPPQSIYNGTKILGNEDNLINLTDMHKAADGRVSQSPRFWRRQDDTKNFLKSLCKQLNVTEDHIWKSQRGAGGGTFVHWQVALAYAKYLSPEFHIWCNDVVRRFVEEEQNPDLAMDRAVKNYRKKGYADSWIGKRFKAVNTRNQLTRVMGMLGCKRCDYPEITNILNTGVLGKSTKAFRKERGLKVNQTRDGMDETELALITASEAIAFRQLLLFSCKILELHSFKRASDCFVLRRHVV